MLHVGIVGTFGASLEGVIRSHLTTPCEIVVADEIGIISRLADVDVLVRRRTMIWQLPDMPICCASLSLRRQIGGLSFSMRRRRLRIRMPVRPKRRRR
jgi:hypothetical protein